MEVTELMLQAAMKKAVETGLVPKVCIGEEEYLKNWSSVKAVIQAALNVASNGQDKPPAVCGSA